MEEPLEDTERALGIPEDSRGSFMHTPDHRYQEALSYLMQESSGEIPDPPSDPVVQYAIRAIRGIKSKDSRKWVMSYWPDIYTALHLGTFASESSITAELESLVLAGRMPTSEDVSKLGISSDVYFLYMLLFMDLSGMRKNAAWMSDNLFEPVRNTKRGKRFRSRMLAFYGSYKEAGLMSAIGAGSDDGVSLMRKLIGTERTKQLFEYIFQDSRVDSNTRSANMESDLKTSIEHEFQEHMKDREEAGSGSLAELAQGLERGIRAFSLDELDKGNPGGIDITNVYLNKIINEAKNVTENIGN